MNSFHIETNYYSSFRNSVLMKNANFYNLNFPPVFRRNKNDRKSRWGHNRLIETASMWSPRRQSCRIQKPEECPVRRGQLWTWARSVDGQTIGQALQLAGRALVSHQPDVEPEAASGVAKLSGISGQRLDQERAWIRTWPVGKVHL